MYKNNIIPRIEKDEIDTLTILQGFRNYLFSFHYYSLPPPSHNPLPESSSPIIRDRRDRL